MKNEKSTATRKLFRRAFNFKAWFDWERTKSFTSYLIQGFRHLFVPHSAKKAESFEAVKINLQLTEEDLASQQRSLKRLSLIVLITSIFIFGYSFYQLLYGGLLACMISFIVAIIALVLAFRYSYWHFLIKERKLDVSIKDWYRQSILGEK